MAYISDERLFAFLSGDEPAPIPEPDPDELIYSLDRPPARRCMKCNGQGERGPRDSYKPMCSACDDLRYIGIDPTVPTCLMPGEEGKVAVIGARYRAGLPFWNPDDATEMDSCAFEYEGD